MDDTARECLAPEDRAPQLLLRQCKKAVVMMWLLVLKAELKLGFNLKDSRCREFRVSSMKHEKATQVHCPWPRTCDWVYSLWFGECPQRVTPLSVLQLPVPVPALLQAPAARQLTVADVTPCYHAYIKCVEQDAADYAANASSPRRTSLFMPWIGCTCLTVWLCLVACGVCMRQLARSGGMRKAASPAAVVGRALPRARRASHERSKLRSLRLCSRQLPGRGPIASARRWHEPPVWWTASATMVGRHMCLTTILTSRTISYEFMRWWTHVCLPVLTAVNLHGIFTRTRNAYTHHRAPSSQNRCSGCQTNGTPPQRTPTTRAQAAHRCQLCRWRLWLLPPIAPADVGTSSKDVMARFTGPSLASPAVQALGSGGLDNTPWHPFAATRRRNASAMRCSDACHITQLSMPPRRNATAHVGTHLVGPHRPARLRHLRRDRLGESVCCDIPRGRA